MPKGAAPMRTQGKVGHTEGPWRWFNYPDGRKLLSGHDRAVIHCPDAPINIDEADQKLIAVVPELLATAKNLVEAINARLSSDKQIPIASEVSALADQIQWALSGKEV